MFLVLLAVKGGHCTHSVHATREVAEQWANCLTYDGKYDCSVAEITDAVSEEIVSLEAKRNAK